MRYEYNSTTLFLNQKLIISMYAFAGTPSFGSMLPTYISILKIIIKYTLMYGSATTLELCFEL